MHRIIPHRLPEEAAPGVLLENLLRDDTLFDEDREALSKRRFLRRRCMFEANSFLR